VLWRRGREEPPEGLSWTNDLCWALPPLLSMFVNSKTACSCTHGARQSARVKILSTQSWYLAGSRVLSTGKYAAREVAEAPTSNTIFSLADPDNHLDCWI
jgi:hypothetical protein